MKRTLLCLIIVLISMLSVSAFADETLQISLESGEHYTIEASRRGFWDCANLDVVSVTDTEIIAQTPGQAMVLVISDSTGSVTYYEVTVTEHVETGELKPDASVPEAIRNAIEFTLNEWQENVGTRFSRLGSKNKYSRWQCGTGSGCDIGWCGAFVGYCLDTCGIPMDDYKASVPHESGEPYSVRAAGVPKIYTGFENMNRLSDVPKPGYLVIYGRKGGYAYTHVGMVTGVRDLGDDKYIVQTVEGNVSSQIKRYCYLYDKNAGKSNYKQCPEDFRLMPDVFNKYQKHQNDWMITTFCATWF